MFDWIKRLLGRTDCKGCVYRRFFGLYCGKRGGILPHSAWQRYGCWHYAEGGDKGEIIDALAALDFGDASLARTAHNEEGVN